MCANRGRTLDRSDMPEKPLFVQTTTPSHKFMYLRRQFNNLWARLREFKLGHFSRNRKCKYYNYLPKNQQIQTNRQSCFINISQWTKLKISSFFFNQTTYTATFIVIFTL